MRLESALIVGLVVMVAVMAAPARGGESEREGGGDPVAYPTVVGDSVDPQAHAYWPVRVRSLGRIDWTYRGGRNPGMVTPRPEGALLVTAGAGHLRSLDPATGRHDWVASANAAYWNYSSCVLGADGTAYCGNHGFVQAVDRAGERLWRTDLAASWIHRPPALSPDGTLLYVVSDAVGLAALDARTGVVRWLYRHWKSPWACMVLDREGHLILGTGKSLTCFDTDGAQRWKRNDGMRDLIVVGDRLYGAASAKGEVRCIDLRTHNYVWRASVAPGITGMALGDDGRLRVAHASGLLTCVDPAGRVRWASKVSSHALGRPSTALGGDTLTVDADGVLHLVDGSGNAVESLATGAAPFRWRPAVGPDGAVYVSQADQVVRVSGDERPLPPRLIATELVVVADDFVVDMWVNGRKVPASSRRMLDEIHGAMSERVLWDLREGDWVVFDVVSNGRRWGGSSYLGVHAVAPDGSRAFSSTTRGNWSACDDPAQVAAFIADRDQGADRLAVGPEHPWSGATDLWRKYLGHDLVGEPVWGTSRNTWIKCIVPSRPNETAPPHTTEQSADRTPPHTRRSPVSLPPPPPRPPTGR